MPYFDEAGIKAQETKEKNNIRLEDNSTSNDVVNESMLRQKLKNLVQKEFFHQLEPVEVLEIVQDQNRNKFGKIIGRYVYSEQNLPLDDCREGGAFIPLNSNIIQMPLPGEVVIGFEFDGNRYYFSAINPTPSNVNNLEELQGYSNTTGAEEYHTKYFEQGSYYADNSDNVKGRKDNRDENTLKRRGGKNSSLDYGDTIIQGRHNNFVHLSSDQRQNPKSDSGNVTIGAYRKNTKGSSIELTTTEQVLYPNQVIDLGNDMKFDREGNAVNKPFIAGNGEGQSGFTEPSIFLNSDRIVLNAQEDDIAIFAKGNVHIKGTSVQIKNAEVVDVNSKQFVQNVENVYRITQDVKAGNVVLLPERIVEEGADKALEFRKNINRLIVKINGLIPAAIPGTRAIPNPAWLNNIRQKIQTARDNLEKNKLITSLKWLDFKTWKTYTIDELREAWSPVPGMAEVISKLSNLQALIDDVERIEEEYNVVKSQVETAKAIIEGPKEYISSFAYGALSGASVTFGGKELIDFEDVLNKYEDDGGDLSQIENGQELKDRIFKAKQEVESLEGIPDTGENEEYIFQRQRVFGDGNPNSQITYDSVMGRFKSDLQSGMYNGFMMKDLELDIQLETETAKRDLTKMLGETAKQQQELEQIEFK
jgi:hypothetical protein